MKIMSKPETATSPVAFDEGSIADERWETIKSRLRITRAENDLLFDQNGRPLIDLFSGNGTAWLGHANERVNEQLAAQLKRMWITGGLETQIHLDAMSAIENLVPASHKVGGLYSTGMEAAEFAIRVARVITGRPDVLGFEKSMHGKSLATAYLGWDNHDQVRLPQFHRLPFVSTLAEEEILDRLRNVLRSNPISAVFVEPMQGSGGGHAGTDLFYEEVRRLCHQSGALLVFDEILTGFYRTGTSFYFKSLGFCPDIFLVGKAMGNGFPVSGIIIKNEHKICPEMLPGSTYAGNPLACTAIAATLGELSLLRPIEKVAEIETIIWNALSPLRERGLQVRGRGAMWIIELPPRFDIQGIALSLYKRGVLMSYTGCILRFLPALTILPTHLAEACDIVREELTAAHGA
jgi:acetylornithine/succinyldiaminopimelate/putrescine aminotransferase